MMYRDIVVSLIKIAFFCHYGSSSPHKHDKNVKGERDNIPKLGK